MMEENSEGVDFISQLPQPLLHHILSFLSIKQIVQTSAVSRTWYEAWNTFQILEFDFYALFSQNRAYYHHPPEEERDSNRQQLYNFVEGILWKHRQTVSFNKFMVIMPWIYQKPEIVVSTLDRWIGYAVDSQVKDVKVVVGPSTHEEEYKYSLPPSLLNAASIQVLDLSHCEFKLPLSSDIKLPRLKKLRFSTVFADDNAISKLLSGCPQIEDLSLISWYGVKTLHIFGLVKLVKICIKTFHDLERLTIERAPNLESIELAGPSMLSWPSEVKIASSCKNLKKLKICRGTMTDEWLRNQLKQIPQLEYLCLFNCPVIQSVKISNSTLRRLEISLCQKVVSVEINTPCLGFFQYCGDIISFSSHHDLILPMAQLNFQSSDMDIPWYARLIDILAKFSNCFKEFVLESDTGQSYIVPRELRQVVAPPLCNLKELNLSISNKAESHPIAEFVDAMLWMSPHLETLTIDTWIIRIKSSFKLTYDQGSTYGGEVSCCKSLPVSCWENCIKNVTIKQVSYNRDTKTRKERNYFFDGDIWQKIKGGILEWVPTD